MLGQHWLVSGKEMKSTKSKSYHLGEVSRIPVVWDISILPIQGEAALYCLPKTKKVIQQILSAFGFEDSVHHI